MPRLPHDRSFPARALLALSALLAGIHAAGAQLSPPAAEPAQVAAPAQAVQPPSAVTSVPAQTAPPAPAAAAEAAEAGAAAEAHLRGEAMLDRAAHFQRGETAQPAPTTLHGRFHVSVRDEKDGSMLQAEAERWFTLSPERMLTHRRESVTGSAASTGWNGTRAWFRNDKDKRVIVYTDRPEDFSVDLDALHEQVRLTRLLLTASVLDALRPHLSGVAATGVGSIKDLDGAVHETDLVTARTDDELFPPPAGAPPPLPDSPAPQLELRFAIDHETGAIWELHVAPLGRTDVQPMRLRFDYHGPTASGLRVPGNIRVYTGGADLESVRLGVDQPEDLLLFDVNAPIDPALFDPPAAG